MEGGGCSFSLSLSLFVFVFFPCAVLVPRPRSCCFLNGWGTVNDKVTVLCQICFCARCSWVDACSLHWHGESMSRLRSLTSRLARCALESLCRIGVVAPRLPSKIKKLACHFLAMQHQSGHRKYTSHTLVRRDCGQRSAVTKYTS